METCLLGLETKTFLHASDTWHPVIPSVHFYAGEKARARNKVKASVGFRFLQL